MDFDAAGKSSTKSPVRKNVAATPSVARVASIEGTASALAPASKVNATTLFEVGIDVMSCPNSDGGNGGVLTGGLGTRLAVAEGKGVGELDGAGFAVQPAMSKSVIARITRSRSLLM